jgi:hypothetical protein
MSIRSITDLAVKRDKAPPGQPVTSKDPGRATERAQDAIISAIPAEILAFYTALTGGALALLIRDDPSAYLPYRWLLLGVALLLTPLAVYRSYLSKFDAARGQEDMPDKPAPPYWEMAASTVAAAAWFLAAPGSPLLAMLSADAGAVTSGAIVIVAATLLWAVFGRPLTLGNGNVRSPGGDDLADLETRETFRFEPHA